MAVECLDASDGFLRTDESVDGRIFIIARVGYDDMRFGQVVDEFLTDHDGTASGTATAVRSGEGLVEVEVHHIDAAVAGFENAEQGVHVRAVAINQPAGFVDDADDFGGILIEQTERIRVGEHQTSESVVAKLS